MTESIAACAAPRSDLTVQRILRYKDTHPDDMGPYADMLTVIQSKLGSDVPGEGGRELPDDPLPEQKAAWHAFNRDFRTEILQASKRLMAAKQYGLMGDIETAYRRSLFLDSRVDFDAYMLYIEMDREPKKRFYQPRRKVLKQIAGDLQQLAEGKLSLLAISLPPGVGKALANETPVMTSNGWKKHGELRVGDEVVGLDGQYKRVLAVHPKCMVDCQVSFTNREKIVCHENHEWLIHDRGRYDAKDRDYVVETKRLETRALESGGERNTRGHRYTVQLPKRVPVQGAHRDLPLDPYTLGAWLGDGSNMEPRICSSKQDVAVIDRVIANGHPIRWQTVHKDTGVLYFGFDIRKQLQELGMCYSRHRTPKHIPEIYLTASVEQRLDLLAGLLDTDGTLTGSKYQFSTTCPQLKDSFIDLIATFGWRTCVEHRAPTTSSSGVTGRRTVFTIGFTPDIQIPTVLDRKRNTDPHEQRRIAFERIDRVDPVEGNCITVEGGVYLVGRSMIPTHNSTLAMFFITWLGGRNPNSPILTFSHDAGIVHGMYEEILRIIRPGEYLWNDVFPEISIAGTNAKDLRIDLDRPKRFQTYQFSSVGAGNAGKLRAAQLLYCDDLVEGVEQAMSKDRMDKLWTQYNTDMQQRKTGECKELHIATRWSVWDVIGRLQRQAEEEHAADKKFIVIPALDENDESNFDYPGIHDKFTTEFYHQQRDNMDPVNWKALYMNEPIEREGQLYDAEQLRRFYELPDGEPDAIVAVCDTKDKGTDYAFMPIAYMYGEDLFIVDCVCDNGDPLLVDERLAEMLKKHKVHSCQFESNSAGGKTAEKVQNRVRELGGRTTVTTKWTSGNKETKIIVNSPYVKEHCLFLDGSKYAANSDYGRMMSMLTGYTMAGRNKHDDVPDGMAMLALYVQSIGGLRVEVFRRPW